MNDWEYIKDKWGKDGVEAPETLSKGAVREMIEGVPQTGMENAPKPKSRRRIAAIAAAAACVAVLVVTPQIRSAMTPDVESAPEGMKTFTSYQEIGKLIKDLEPEMPYVSNGLMDGDLALSEDAVDGAVGSTGEVSQAVPKNAEAPASALGSADTGAATQSAGGEHSDTYVQVEGVDEADIIKTDGKYIYHVTGEGEVRISSASKGKTKAVATISQFEEDGWIQDMFLSEDRLITVGTMMSGDENKAAVTTYDISNPEKPKQVHQFLQSGYAVASRLTGGRVYLVTSDFVGYDHRVVPYVTTNGKYKRMPISDICCFPNPKEPSYVVVSAVDISSGSKVKSKSKAVLGASEDIYCNQENLYIACSTYQEAGNQFVTKLLKVELNDGKLEFTANGKVRGMIDNQFSMDERDGYFRIATTSDRNGKDVNNLFVLDENLKKVGEVTGFARNEHIEAVRYIGNKAYVITYETTDPLFIIDLSDPKAPKIEGEVKITGFSTLLVPVNEKTLLGIGYSTEENEWGEAVDGVKLALFDISNPAKPEVKDSKTFRNYSSQAQYDHHALLTGLPDGGYAIPYSRWVEKTDEYNGGVLTFTAEDQIKVTEEYKVKEEVVSRCIRIDEYIYALDENDEFHGFELK